MNVAIESEAYSLHLASAILLYQDRQKHIRYASHHAITQDEAGKAHIEPGTGISSAALEKAYSELMGSQNLFYLEERVLAYNGSTFIVWLPPKPRKVYFDAPEPMGKREGITPHPGLVFAIYPGSDVRIFAVKGPQRPTPETKLYLAPYLNIYGDNGSICMGNVQAPDPSPDSIDAWESAFFNSYFTHANYGIRTSYPGGIYSLWNDLLDGMHTTFPEQVLVSPKGEADFLLSELLGDTST
ncbi:PRTRC system protein B [Acidithiobacillus caldus]|uniref:PRTRC system protein B n=2 Tax=Acidithiobacillus caldus TaxID=33059 RepID=F9ZRY9_ACICS|nr:PRTRC system protein B [Acidithiobacillus caldus]AEK58774.1 conserved hypothetical protein [Acidithiobacillus caldus SM-1]OFC30365.1 hypothetical protein BAE27_11875 [Acidithiobacillus caldus]OFC30682.1 hypothetical protein BAE28_13130 [Acidithiobacillus caldus]OFC35516.1 hypothetical protein BAE29_15295 [Acidithiobacillus caldus]OFC62432.1 hypothetical protein BAE30_01990 [Acidithiobacillus caldus]